MSTYKAPLQDMQFVLFDVLDTEPMFQRMGFADATRDVLEAVLEEGARFTESVLAPLNAVGDQVGSAMTNQPARSPRLPASGRPTINTSTAAGPG